MIEILCQAAIKDNIVVYIKLSQNIKVSKKSSERLFKNILYYDKVNILGLLSVKISIYEISGFYARIVKVGAQAID